MVYLFEQLGGVTKKAMPKWWKGRHGGLKIRCPYIGCGGSNPSLGTNQMSHGGTFDINPLTLIYTLLICASRVLLVHSR